MTKHIYAIILSLLLITIEPASASVTVDSIDTTSDSVTLNFISNNTINSNSDENFIGFCRLYVNGAKGELSKIYESSQSPITIKELKPRSKYKCYVATNKDTTKKWLGVVPTNEEIAKFSWSTHDIEFAVTKNSYSNPETLQEINPKNIYVKGNENSLAVYFEIVKDVASVEVKCVSSSDQILNVTVLSSPAVLSNAIAGELYTCSLKSKTFDGNESILIRAEPTRVPNSVSNKNVKNKMTSMGGKMSKSSKPIVIAQAFQSGFIKYADIDSDGIGDLAISGTYAPTDYQIRLYYGEKSGKFKEGRQRFYITDPKLFDLKKINSDKYLDIVIYENSSIRNSNDIFPIKTPVSSIISSGARNYSEPVEYKNSGMSIAIGPYEIGGIGTIYKIENDAVYDLVLGKIPYMAPKEISQKATILSSKVMDADGNGYSDVVFTYSIPPAFGRETIDKNTYYTITMFVNSKKETKWGPLLPINVSNFRVLESFDSTKMYLYDSYSGKTYNLHLNTFTTQIPNVIPVLDKDGNLILSMKNLLMDPKKGIYDTVIQKLIKS